MFQVANQCYPTAAEASSALAATLVGRVESFSGVPHLVQAVNPGADGIAVTWQSMQTQALFTNWQSVNFPACELLTYQDALSIGWGIAGAWIATYAIMFLARYLLSEMRNDHVANDA